MRYLYLMLFALASTHSWAQCPHDPVITGDTILCPNETGTLQVQAADAYQWYQRAWGAGTAQPLPGDTNQTLTVNNMDHGLTYISVETEVNGCVERSPEVLIDGYAFLPPVVQSTGSYRTGQSGEFLLCEGDTVFFELMLPYTENIQWFESGSPISGAVSPTLTVTQSGYYTVEGAPGVCPNYIQHLGVTLEVIRFQTIEPVTNYQNDTLFLTNSDSMQQIRWYRNDTLVQNGGPSLSINIDGAYHIETIDKNGCEGETAPMYLPPLGIPHGPTSDVTIYPTLAQSTIHISQTQPHTLNLRVVNVMGQILYQNQLSERQSTISTQAWPAGTYWVQWQTNNSGWESRPVSIVR